MKNVLCLLSLLIILLEACAPTAIPSEVKVGLSLESFSGAGTPASDTTITIFITNPSGEDVTINWTHSITQAVSGWTYDMNGNTASSGELTIAANTSFKFTFKIKPNGFIGNGLGNIAFYDVNYQSTTTQTFTYNYTTPNVSSGVALTLLPNTMNATGRGAKMMDIRVENASSRDATINWVHTATQAVSGWTYTINGSLNNTGSFTVLADSFVTIRFEVDPNGAAGNGIGEIAFYDAWFQSTTTQSFSYNLNAITTWFSLKPVGLMTRSIRTNDPDTDYHIWVVNDNAAPVDVKWRRNDNGANPIAWVSTICTDATCWSPSIISKTVTIAPNDSVDFKYTISHQATTGSGGATLEFYVPSDRAYSSKSQVVNHTVTN